MVQMPNHSDFIQTMKANRAGLLATLGGGALIFVIWQFALILLGISLPEIVSVFGGRAGFETPGQEAYTMLVFLVFGFGPGLCALLAWRKWMERLAAKTLFTARAQFRWALMAAACGFMIIWGLGLTLLLDDIGTADIMARVRKFAPFDWAMLALAYGAGIAVQATFEEVLVRGWLLQQMARIIPSVAGAIVSTSILFSVLHIGHAGWATYVATLFFGLAFGWSAYRLNGLEAAIGAHIGNNLVAALFAGQMLTGNPEAMSPTDMMLFGLYVLGFLALVEGWARLVPAPSRP